MKKTIFLYNTFGAHIITRNSMRMFLNLLSKTPDKEIVLDFKNILFISRSCADEYVKWRINFMERKNIQEVNMDEKVEMMFKLVSLQYKKSFGLAA